MKTGVWKKEMGRRSMVGGVYLPPPSFHLSISLGLRNNPIKLDQDLGVNSSPTFGDLFFHSSLLHCLLALSLSR